MGYTFPMGVDVILVSSTETYADSDTHSTPIDTSLYTEGVFMLEVAQGSYGNETIDVNIQVYDLLTEDWYTIASFTQVTNATTTQREAIRIPYGLGRSISCNWAITGGDSTNKYTITVSGVLK